MLFTVQNAEFYAWLSHDREGGYLRDNAQASMSR